MKDSEYTQTRKTAINALNHWATTGLGQFTMCDIVSTYLEASDANRSSIGGEEVILAHRKKQLTDWRLTVYMLYPKRNYPRWIGNWNGLQVTF